MRFQVIEVTKYTTQINVYLMFKFTLTLGASMWGTHSHSTRRNSPCTYMNLSRTSCPTFSITEFFTQEAITISFTTTIIKLFTVPGS